MTALRTLIAQEHRRQRAALAGAGACAALAGASGVILLGLSGGFIAGAALAGAAGAAAFNYMLPSAAIRLFAILRTGGRYGERLAGHAAALNALARVRRDVFLALTRACPADALALSTGEGSARLIQDVGALEALFVRRSTVLGGLAAGVAGAALAALASPTAALAVCLAFAAAWLTAHSLSRRLSDPAGRWMQDAFGSLKAAYAAMAAAAPELVAFGLQDWAADQVGQASADLTQARKTLDRADGWRSAAQGSRRSNTDFHRFMGAAPEMRG